MFILVQPMYSKQELNADSNYVVYTQLISAMRSVRPGWHWVVIFPDKESGFKYDDDGFFRSHNVSRVPQRMSPRKMSNAVSFDGAWYDRLFRQIGFDTVWCNLPEMAAALKCAGAGTFEYKARPPIIAAHNYVIHPTLPYPFDVQGHVAFAQLSGAIFADHNVFNSDYCRWMLFDNAKRWLNQETMEIIAAKSSQIPYGTLEPELLPVETDNPVPVIAYNHRLQAYKNFQRTFELLDELYQEGLRFRVRYMNNTTEMTTQIAKYPFVEIKLCANRRDYLAALRGCDLNVTNSQHETFCIAAIESMALGQPLIAPNGITFPEITGRETTRYPYLFTSPEEQKAMVRHLLTHEADRRRWGLVMSEWVRSHYQSPLWAERYAALFEQYNDIQLGVADDAKEMVAEKLRRNSGMAVAELFLVIQATRVNGRQPFGNQSLPLTKLVRLVRDLGGSVQMKEGVQRAYAP